MRILAIRGENISSLQTFFEINYEKEPLASTGIYAISGPTGAGKSTILDALCLALYQTTPRLESVTDRQAKIVDFDNKAISVSNPCQLLRRGASSCFVEVDFEGVDRFKYRSRWSVRRAHDKPSGSLQSPKAELRNLTLNQLITDNLTDHETAVPKALGLTFSEFTRSVLLAQNEFTSFLRASDNERAAILEKLTGIDIFARVSKYVFDKTKSLTQELETLKSQRNLFPILEPHALEAQKQRLQELSHSISMHEDLRGKFQGLLNSKKDFEKALEIKKLSESEFQKKCETLAALEFELHQKKASHAEACERLTSAGPVLTKAKHLTGEIDALNQQCTPLQQELTAKQQSLDSIVSKKSKLEEQFRQTEQNVNFIVQWQNDHKHIAVWAQGWVEYNSKLDAASALQQSFNKAQTLLSTTQKQSHNNQKAIAELRAEESATKIEIDNIDAQSELLRREREKQEDGTSLNDTLLKLTETKSITEKKIAFLQECLLFEAEMNTLSKQTESQLANISRLRAAKEHSIEKQKIAEKDWIQADTAERNLAQMTSPSVQDLRGTLVPGHPCPVCGSTHHPLSEQSESSKVSEELQTARNRALGKKKEFDAAQQNSQKAAEELTHALAEYEQMQKSLHKLQAKEIEMRSELHLQNLPWPVTAQNLLNATNTANEIQVQLSLLKDKVQQEAKLAKEAETLRRSLQEQNNLLRIKFEKRASLEGTQSTLAERLRNLEQEASESEEKLTNVLDSLDILHPSSPNWRANWTQDPAAYHASLRSNVEEWQQKETAILAMRSALEKLKIELQSLKNLHQEKQNQWSETNHAIVALRNKIHEKQTELQGLLSGVSLSSFERILTETISAAQQKLEECQSIFNSQLQEKSRLLGLSEQAALMSSQAESNYQNQLSLCETAAINLNFNSEQLHESHFQKRLEEVLKRMDEEKLTINTALIRDTEHRQKQEKIQQQISKQEDSSLQWQKLNILIGSKEGDKFRKQAHQLTLNVLFAHANHQLRSFARRYELCTEGQGILVKDLDLGGVKRSVYSLSGGESFLVSLALAMGLASLSSQQIPVESLFIDEGFGSLDSETLKIALDALDRLQAQGRKVGVISHVPEMGERIGIQIKVRSDSEGRSRIILP